MLSERQMKSELRHALDEVLPAAPWLEASVAESLSDRLHNPARAAGIRWRLARPAFAAAILALFVAAAILLAQLYAPRPVPGSPTGLTPAEQGQLAALVHRPLSFPIVPAGDLCPDSPRTVVRPWSNPADSATLSGAGPAFMPDGGVLVDAGRYFDVTFYTGPAARGVMLFRGRNLRVGNDIYFTGQWSAGPVVGRDTLNGLPVQLFGGVAVPADRPPHAEPAAAPGWGLWTVRWKSGFSNGDCVAFQVDYPAGTEMIVFNG